MAIGNSALNFNTTGINNIGIGHHSLYFNTTGSENMGIGNSVLHRNTTGSFNLGMGVSALYNNTTGKQNIGFGNYTLHNNTTGEGNIGIGPYSLQHNTTGIRNLAIGVNALNSNITGEYNMALGYATMAANTTGANNVAIGAMAFRNGTTGQNNTALGASTLGANITGHGNTVVGYKAGEWIRGNSNIHIGSANIQDVTAELDNVIAIGNGMNLSTTTAYENVILLGHDQANSPKIGMGIYKPDEKLHVAGNIAVGYKKSGPTTYPGIGNYLSFEGTAPWSDGMFPNSDVLAFYRYDYSQDHSQLRLLIGDNEGSGDSFSIGVRPHSAANSGYSRGNIANIANVYSEKFKFAADGQAYKHGSNVWTVFSDARIKENVKPYTKGLKEILQIRPVNFNYKKEADKGDKTYAGVIAQELEKVVPTMVNTTNEKINGVEGIKSVDGNEYTFMLINAVKELSQKVEKLEAEIKTLKSKKK